MHYQLVPFLIVFGVIGFFFVLSMIVGLWEKHPVQPYYVPQEGKEFKLTPKARESNDEAKSLGFLHCALLHDGKGKIYRLRYDVWVSPSGNTLGIISSGTVAGQPFDAVWLYSRRSDGRFLSTTNHMGSQDISGINDQATWTALPFAPLFRKHARRLPKYEIMPFNTESPLPEYFAIRRATADALVERRYAYYMDDEQKIWRYTLAGALAYYFLGTWIRPLLRCLRFVGLWRE